MIIEMREADFNKQYPLIANHLDANASWNGCLYETFGKQLAFIEQQPSNTIWTLVEEDGKQFLLSGFHFVNRLGYLISTVAVSEGQEIAVLDDLVEFCVTFNTYLYADDHIDAKHKAVEMLRKGIKDVTVDDLEAEEVEQDDDSET
jgi:hypothetical protein